MDLETRRKRQKALIVKMVERKVRSRAQQLYDSRGPGDGHALQDWVQAETEVVGNSIMEPLYRRSRTENQPATEMSPARQNSSACESPA